MRCDCFEANTIHVESHANRIYSIATSPKRQAALPLLRRLIDWPADKPIRVRSIQKYGWAFLKDSDSIERALDLLIDCGWVRAIEIKPLVGRPTTEFVLHPEAAKYLKPVRNRTGETGETPSECTFAGFAGSKSRESEINSAPRDPGRGCRDRVPSPCKGVRMMVENLFSELKVAGVTLFIEDGRLAFDAA